MIAFYLKCLYYEKHFAQNPYFQFPILLKKKTLGHLVLGPIFVKKNENCHQLPKFYFFSFVIVKCAIMQPLNLQPSKHFRGRVEKTNKSELWNPLTYRVLIYIFEVGMKTFFLN